MVSSVSGWDFVSSRTAQSRLALRICIHEQSYLFHLCVWEVFSEERGPHETHSLLRKCGHCCPLVVPSHFIQGTTCPRIPLSSNDGWFQGSRYMYMSNCLCTTHMTYTSHSLYITQLHSNSQYLTFLPHV